MQCDGVSLMCPSDQRSINGTVCRPSTSQCDAPELVSFVFVLKK